ncbi:MAG: hypothetical protein ACXWPM_08195 [Bdellovibrionota bacterium]
MRELGTFLLITALGAFAGPRHESDGQFACHAIHLRYSRIRATYLKDLKFKIPYPRELRSKYREVSGKLDGVCKTDHSEPSDSGELSHLNIVLYELDFALTRFETQHWDEFGEVSLESERAEKKAAGTGATPDVKAEKNATLPGN